MEAKFPEGPWTAKGTRIYAADGEEIAVATRASPRYRGCAGKTARLIAAAPEMYEALSESQSLLAQLTAKWPTGKPNTAICKQTDRNSDVLAKARGET